MAELALAGTIVKIAGTAVGIATQLYGIGSAIGKAGMEVRLIAIEIKSTAQVLSHLATVLKSQGRRQPDASRIAKEGLDICQPLLTEMEGLIHILNPLINRINHGKTRNFTLRLKWLLKKSKFALHRQTLDSLKISLALLISSMNYVEGSRNSESEDILLVDQCCCHPFQSAYTALLDSISLSKQLKEALTDVAPLTRPVALQISGSFRASEHTNPFLTESNEDEIEISSRIATLGINRDQEDANTPASLAGVSYEETIDLPIQAPSTALSRVNARDQTSDAEFLGDWEIGGESQALWLHFEATKFAQETINHATDASNGRSARPERAAVTPRFAWVCSTPLDYSVACLMLDKEIVLNKDTAWAHDASFTFGQISKNEIVIIYHPVENEDSPEHSASEEVLRNLLKTRFDCVELVLIVGSGGAIPEFAPKFDIRLGDIVVGETMSMGLDGRTGTFKFRGQLSWWVHQAVAKLELHPFLADTSCWYNIGSEYLADLAERHFKYAGPAYDTLYSRKYEHKLPGHDCTGCSPTAVVPRQRRPYHIPVVHLGHAFVSRNESEIPRVGDQGAYRIMREWTSKPMVITRNGGTLIGTFPCIIISGISNYCDTHDQSMFSNHAAFRAAQYAKKLVSDL